MSLFFKVEKKLYNAPDQPTTTLDALNQRMAKYKSCEEEAKASGNSSKVRRMGRIVKVRIKPLL